jgi:hypothetical protein
MSSPILLPAKSLLTQVSDWSVDAVRRTSLTSVAGENGERMVAKPEGRYGWSAATRLAKEGGADEKSPFRNADTLALFGSGMFHGNDSFDQLLT